MRTSRDHILTSHAGSLPRPDDLIEANRARDSGQTADDRRFEDHLKAAVADVVSQQKAIGIDVPGDGEFGKSMGHKVNYRAWWSYCFNRWPWPLRHRPAAEPPGRGPAHELLGPA